MSGTNYNSIQNPRQYRALRRRGYSKEAAARISNARTPGHRVKDSGVTGLSIPPTGPNALFNQLGTGVSRRRRKRLKAANWGAGVGQTISGALGRGEGGRFVNSGKPSARSATSAARRERTNANRAARQQRMETIRAAREQAAAAEAQIRTSEDAYIAAGKTGHERQRRRAEIAAKRRERAAARREAQRQALEQERAKRAEEDAAEAQRREQEDVAGAAEKPKKGGGGGGGKKKPSDDEKRAEAERKQTANRAATAPKAGLSTAEAEFLAGAASGTLPPGSFDARHLAALGLTQDAGDTTEATDAGRRALAALERGDVRGVLAAIQDGKAKIARDRARGDAKRARDAEKKKREAEQAKRDGERKRQAAARENPPTPPPPPTPDAAAERTRNRTLTDQAIRNLSERRQRRRRKEASHAFAVFKDANGAARWAAITTTAYQDKDGEWIGTKAIRGVVDAGDAGTPRGPLRFWHVPGLDLGDCDYQATAYDDRFLIESGTFRSPAAARIGMKAAAAGYQMSPGFLHTRREPRGGLYEHIALFERSFVPPGRAANPGTSFITKGDRMLTDEKKKEFEALAGDAEGRALLEGLLAQAATTVKANDDAGAVYKDAPAWAQALAARLDGLEERLKAFPPAAAAVEEAVATDDDLAAMEAKTAAVDESTGMDDESFAQMLAERIVAAITPLFDIEKKMRGMVDELKGSLSPMAAKDDTRAKEIAGIDARLKELEGTQPRARTSLAGDVWGQLSGVSVTKEQAAQLAAKPAGEIPAGLNDPIEADAYRLIFGE